MKMRNLLKRFIAIGACMALLLPATGVCAAETQETVSAQSDSRGVTVWTYHPGMSMLLQYSDYEDIHHGEMADDITVDIPGLNATFDMKFIIDGAAYIDMSYNVDVKQGTYDTIITFKRKDGSIIGQDDESVKVRVNEDMQGVHFVNTVAVTDGSEDAVFHFKNGTGESEIVSIQSVNFMAKDTTNRPDSTWDEYWGFVVFPSQIEYDLEAGTVTIPKEWFQNRYEQYGMKFIPYVYCGALECTLANGVTVSGIAEPLVPEGILADDFVNPGDEMWYLVYNGTYGEEPTILKGDMTLDGEVNLGDLALMLQVVNERVSLSQLSEAQITAGDVSQASGEATGTINLGDISKLLQYINERIDSL